MDTIVRYEILNLMWEGRAQQSLALSNIFVARITAFSPTLMSDTLLEGSTTCPGETVVFTCQTIGSLAWSSDEYIGTGGKQLPFGHRDREGSRHTISDNIYAELVNVSILNDATIITSTFHITASLSSSVICTATEYNKNSTIYLRILGKLLSNVQICT